MTKQNSIQIIENTCCFLEPFARRCKKTVNKKKEDNPYLSVLLKLDQNLVHLRLVFPYLIV